MTEKTKLQIINAGGVVYLGQRNGDKIVGVEVRAADVKAAIDSFIKASNVGELVTVELTGDVGVASKAMKKEDQRFLAERLAVMDEVKQQATELLENHLFDNDGKF